MASIHLLRFTGFNSPVFQELQVVALALSAGFDVLETLQRVKTTRERHCTAITLEVLVTFSLNASFIQS